VKGSIFIVQDSGQLVEMTEPVYDSEDWLQRLLAQHPNLLAGRQIDKESPRKQRHTATRVYHRLMSEEGFVGGASTVRRYVRQAKIRLGVSVGKAFIPLEDDCGKEDEHIAFHYRVVGLDI
jgi:hypothetical protein